MNIARDNEGKKLGDSTIGNRIYLLRIQHGESQKDLADATDITQSTISKLERDAISPKAALLSRIAKHYRVDPSYLTDGEEAAMVNINESKEIIAQLSAVAQLKKELNLKDEQVAPIINKILASIGPSKEI